MDSYHTECSTFVAALLCRLSFIDTSFSADPPNIVLICDNGTNRSITSRANGREICGGKGQTTRAGMHVPLVVRWPAVVKPFQGIAWRAMPTPLTLDSVNQPFLRHLAEQLASGSLSIDEFLARAGGPRSERLEGATVDLDRQRRCGYPEVVYGEGKSVEALVGIFQTLLARQVEVLATRIDVERAATLREHFPNLRYNELARTVRIPAGRLQANAGTDDGPTPTVAVITAGTSDRAVAEEARETLDWMGVAVTMIHDVGVAGPHRLPERLADFQSADAVVVVAGMEGALPSVVAGYVPCPVIAVPTSVGYGASFGGVAALLSMLNSCASNVAVVNIDSGFKAGYLAGLIAKRSKHAHADTHN